MLSWNVGELAEVPMARPVRDYKMRQKSHPYQENAPDDKQYPAWYCMKQVQFFVFLSHIAISSGSLQ